MFSEEQRKPLIRVYEAIIQSPHSAIAINGTILVKNYGTLLQYKEKKKSTCKNYYSVLKNLKKNVPWIYTNKNDGTFVQVAFCASTVLKRGEIYYVGKNKKIFCNVNCIHTPMENQKKTFYCLFYLFIFLLNMFVLEVILSFFLNRTF